MITDSGESSRSKLFPVNFLQLLRSSPFGFTLVELLVVIAIIGVLIALLLPAIQAAREAAFRMQCTNHLKQFGLAVHNFHDTQNGLPPSTIGYLGTDPYNTEAEKQGRTTFWVFILPFMEQQTLYDFVKEKSDSFRLGLNGTNLWNFSGESDSTRLSYQETLSSVTTFLCPSRRNAAGNFIGRTDSGDSSQVFGPQSDYAIVVGRLDTHWSYWVQYQDVSNVDYMNAQRGPFRPAIWENNLPQQWKCRDSMSWLNDGTSNQIMIGEKLIYFDAVGVCRDASSANRPYVGDCSIFASGEWKCMSMSRSFNAGIENNYKKTPANFYAENTTQWGSSHSGVCNFLVGDGSVRTISVTIATGALAVSNNGTLNPNSILAKLGNVNDGNIVTLY
ncbi:MAG: DUF1559 domain-containing protein [Planctomycetaceae bacterium]|nr:DUF1559 domain-containing protein [Planctomycetaceae bacterium]